MHRSRAHAVLHRQVQPVHRPRGFRVHGPHPVHDSDPHVLGRREAAGRVLGRGFQIHGLCLRHRAAHHAFLLRGVHGPWRVPEHQQLHPVIVTGSVTDTNFLN